jgi:hypothetical protein
MGLVCTTIVVVVHIDLQLRQEKGVPVKKRDVKTLIHDKGLERDVQVISIGGIDRLVLNGMASAIHDWQSVYDIVDKMPTRVVPKGLSDVQLAAYMSKSNKKGDNHDQ